MYAPTQGPIIRCHPTRPGKSLTRVLDCMKDYHTLPSPSSRFKVGCYLFSLLVNDASVHILCDQYKGTLIYGDDAKKRFVLVFSKAETVWDIIRSPDPGLGETYMDNLWRLEHGDLGEFITMLAKGRQKLFKGKLGIIFRRLLNKVPEVFDHKVDVNYQQVQHHYDIGNSLYKIFLDEGMNYSCAFFATPEQSLRDAQLNKIDTSIGRLDIQAGMKVLDIGSGWGELTRCIADKTHAEVDGVTLAETQIAYSKEIASTVAHAPRYHLADYREHAARHQAHYDRIISVGMFEHVGNMNYHEYFKAINDQLVPGGKALVHSIVKPDEPTSMKLSSPWLEKYIFPGGCTVTVQRMVDEAKQQGLELDAEPYIQESFHYAETLRRWRANFLANFNELDGKQYDQRFKNMWVYYLAMSEAMFDGANFRIVQIVLRSTK